VEEVKRGEVELCDDWGVPGYGQDDWGLERPPLHEEDGRWHTNRSSNRTHGKQKQEAKSAWN
jgi:hypothetical protein